MTGLLVRAGSGSSEPFYSYAAIGLDCWGHIWLHRALSSPHLPSPLLSLLLSSLLPSSSPLLSSSLLSSPHLSSPLLSFPLSFLLSSPILSPQYIFELSFSVILCSLALVSRTLSVFPQIHRSSISLHQPPPTSHLPPFPLLLDRPPLPSLPMDQSATQSSHRADRLSLPPPSPHQRLPSSTPANISIFRTFCDKL